MRIATDVEICRWETKFTEIPEDLAKHFSPLERRAYRQGSSFFKDLGEKCKYPPLKKLLRAIAKVDVFRVHMHRWNDGPFVLHFGFTFVTEGDYVKFRLPTKVKLPGNPPAFLQRLYASTGGLLEDLPYHRGWECPEDVVSLSSQYDYAESRTGIDLSEAYSVLSIGDGDTAGYLPNGDGFVFDHETGKIREFDLQDFAKGYFGDYFNRYEDEG
jgi:hypothetical protein